MVLGCQLNKAVAAKNNSDVALRKLMDHVALITKRLEAAGGIPGGSGGGNKALNLKPDGTLRFRPSDGPPPVRVAWFQTCFPLKPAYHHGWPYFFLFVISD